jgi:lysozyme
MQMSALGLDLIRRSEGFRGSTYLDPAGIPTIGYGHRLLPPESYPHGIAEQLAEQLLAGDVRLAEHAVARLVRVALTQGQFDALTDFCFNLGAGRLASSTLLDELNCGQYDAAGAQLLHWDLAGGAICPGLKVRREAELQLWGGAAGQTAA